MLMGIKPVEPPKPAPSDKSGAAQCPFAAMAGKLPNPHNHEHPGHSKVAQEKTGVAYNVHLALKPYYPIFPRIFFILLVVVVAIIYKRWF